VAITEPHSHNKIVATTYNTTSRTKLQTTADFNPTAATSSPVFINSYNLHSLYKMADTQFTQSLQLQLVYSLQNGYRTVTATIQFVLMKRFALAHPVLLK
jgi:fucose permease